MSYRVRYTFPDGRAGHWMRDYATCEAAQRAIDERRADTGLAYTVEEVLESEPKPTTPRRNISYVAKWFFRDGRTAHETAPFATREDADKYAKTLNTAKGWTYTVEEVAEPGSTAAHHVEILRDRVNELEAMVETLRKKLNETLTDNDDIHRDLAFALDLGRAMREAMRTGEWRAGHDKSMANSAMSGWDRWKTSLARAYSVPVGASDAPGDGGDSDLRRLEALRAFLEGNEDASLSWWEGEFNAVAEDVAITAPTLLTLADKLAAKEGKP